MLFPKMFPLKLVKVKLNLFVPNCLWGLSSFYQNLDHVLVRFAGLKSCKVSPSGCLRKGIVRLHLSGKRKPSLGTLYSPSASFIEMEHCQVLRGPCFLPPHSHNHSSPNTLTLSFRYYRRFYNICIEKVTFRWLLNHNQIFSRVEEEGSI